MRRDIAIDLGARAAHNGRYYIALVLNSLSAILYFPQHRRF